MEEESYPRTCPRCKEALPKVPNRRCRGYNNRCQYWYFECACGVAIDPASRQVVEECDQAHFLRKKPQ